MEKKHARRGAFILPAGAALVLLFFEFELILYLRSSGVCTGAIAAQVVLALLCFGAVGACVYMFRKGRAEAHRVYPVMALALGLLCMFLLQPLTVPDEIVHYRQSYRLSNLLLFRDANYMRAEDETVMDTMTDANGYTGNSLDRYDRVVAQVRIAMQTEGDATLSDTGLDAVRTVPLGYVASALGVTLARLLGMSGFCLFYLGRFFNLLVFVGLFTAAIRVTPRGKWAFAIVGLFPVTLQEAASFSYDGMVIATLFLFFALILRLREGGRASLRYVVWCAIVGMFAIANKVCYFPVALLFLLIPAKNLGGRKRKLWLVAITVAGAIALLVYASFSTVRTLLNRGVLDAAAGVESKADAASVSFYLHNPSKFVSLILRSTLGGISKLSLGMAANQMSYLDIDPPTWLSCGMLLFLFLAAQNERDTQIAARHTWEKYLVAFIIAASYVLILLPQMISNTSVTDTHIHGLNARYFTPLLCMLPFLAQTKRIELRRDTYPLLFFAQTAFSLLVLIILPHFI